MTATEQRHRFCYSFIANHYALWAITYVASNTGVIAAPPEDTDPSYSILV